MSRRENATRNAVWGISYQMISLLLPFITRTMIIRLVGAQYVGLSGLFSAIIQILNITELGFNSAVVFNLYKPIAEKDTEKICALMAFYRGVYRIVGCIIVVAGVGVMPFLEKLIKGTWPVDINITILYAIYLSNTALGYFLFSYKTVLLTAHQRSDMVSKVSGMVTISLNGLQIIILYATRNFYCYAILIPIFTAIGNILRGYVVDRRYPEYLPKGKLDRETKKEIQKQVGGLLIQKVCGATRNSLDSVFISAFIGLTDITIYGNYYFVMSSIHAVMLIGAEAMQAGIGDTVASESVEKNFDILQLLDFIYMGASIILTTGMIVMYQDFMRLWVGAQLLAPFRVVLAISLYFYLLCIGDIRSLFTAGAGLWWHGKVRAILETVMNLVLNWILVQKMGITGIILATVCSILLVNIPYGSYITFKYYFNFYGLKKYILSHVRYFIQAIIVCMIVLAVCNLIPRGGILLFLIKGIVCVAVSCVSLLFMNFRNGLYKRAVVLLKDTVKRKIR